MQTVLTLMVGALCWFVQRSIKKFDDGIEKLDRKIDDVDQKNDAKCDALKKELHALKEDMPFVYTTREDFLRIMNNVDDKLNRILYGRNGGSSSD